MSDLGGFGKADARRIADVVRWFERNYRNLPLPVKQQPTPLFQGLVPVLLNTGIAAGTTTTPTTATATMFKPSGTGGGLASAGKTVTVYNPYAKAVLSNKFAWVTPYNNRLYLVTADC